MSEQESKLLPCPFCGGEDIRADANLAGDYLQCWACGARGPLSTSECSNWQARAAQPAPDAAELYNRGFDDGRLQGVKEGLERAAQSAPAGAMTWDMQREAQQCLWVMREIACMDADDVTGDNVDLRFEDANGFDAGCDVSIVEYAERTAKVLEAVLLSQSAPAGERETIRAVFLRNGFTVKDGQTDLKPYVYAAAEELLSIARAAWQRTQAAPNQQAESAPALSYKDDPRTPVELSNAGCRCVRFGEGNPHWPCRIHAGPAQGEREAPVVVATAILGGLFHGGSGPELGEIDIEVCTPALEALQCETVDSSDDVFMPLMTVTQHRRILAHHRQQAGKLAEALRGMLQLDEENHQRYSGDEDVCLEVRKAREALADWEKTNA